MPITSLIIALLLFCTGTQQQLTAAQAKDHIGEKATVCGSVASANYAQRAKRTPTFLNLDKAFPNPIFTVVIWGDDRAKFGQPETELRGKRICVSGQIEDFKGAPEIILREKTQLKVE